ncbi:MAG: segregation/condensation protein A [Phycisphaerae bacterium]
MDEYRVQLDVFSGPLDLLLYLIRRDELDIQDISIARLTEQYLEFLHVLEQLDPNAAGEFLVMATTLLEIKSRALLPTPPIEALEDGGDPRTVLVRQLLEYKRFKDAARALGTAADDRAARYIRRPAELPEALRGVELEEVQLWDLVAAFGKVMTAIGAGPGRHEVQYDETPIEELAETILELLEAQSPTAFRSLFADRRDRAGIVGLFLALLELLRRQRVRIEQDTCFGEIYIFATTAITESPTSEPAAVTSQSVRPGEFDSDSEHGEMKSAAGEMTSSRDPAGVAALPIPGNDRISIVPSFIQDSGGDPDV